MSQLSYNAQSGLARIYAEGVAENAAIKTLSGVEQAGKPDERIQASFLLNGQEAAVTDLRATSDEVKYIVANEDSFFFHLQTRQEVRNALASDGAYGDDPMPQFSLKPLSPADLLNLGVPSEIAILLGAGSGVPGFKAELYQDFITGENQYVLAFAGTHGTSLEDWIDNIKQGLGYPAAQYQKAMEIVTELLDVAEFQNANLVTTGHSLGGGLASAAAVAGNIPAHTFNAAGLHPNTLNEQLYTGSTARFNNAATLIDAYYVHYDVLSLVQDDYSTTVAGVTIDPPSAIGQRIGGEGLAHNIITALLLTLGEPEEGEWSWGHVAIAALTVESHLMPSVLYSLLDAGGVY